MAKNVQSSTNEDVSDSTSYRDDAFESSYNKSESFGNYDASFASSKLSDSRTFKLPKSGEPMDEDDMLLQESKHLHNKLKAQRRRESHGHHGVAQLEKATPIKEEDIEEEFEDSGTNSKTTGG